MARYVKVCSLSVSACEPTLKPENMSMVDYVIDYLDRNLRRVVCDKPDLIVLPEVCDRPNGLNQEQRTTYYQERGDQVGQYLQRVARENHCYIVYPCHYFFPDGTAVNCCQMIDRQGTVIGRYDKNFPTIGECESTNVKSGTEATIFECDFGRVGAAICFDLNFDEHRAKLKEANPDLIVFSSNFHGGILQNYFAYDTRSYLICSIGYARIPGGIISPVGERIAETTTYYNFVTETINLDYAVCHLDNNMGKIQAARDKYGDKIKLQDPGHLGAVLLTSETEEFTIQDVIDEFEIELLDQYLDRSRAYVQLPENIRRG